MIQKPLMGKLNFSRKVPDQNKSTFLRPLYIQQLLIYAKQQRIVL
jgi:hypothetical protein